MFGIGDKLIGLLGSIIQFLYDSLIEPFTEMPTLRNWIFGNVDVPFMGNAKEDMIFNTFTPNEINNIYGNISPTFFTLAYIGFVIFMVIGAMRVSSAAINPLQRNALMDLVKSSLLVGILLMNMDALYNLIFTLNSSIVNAIWGAMSEQDLGTMGAALQMVTEEEDGLVTADASGIFGLAIAGIFLLGLSIWASFYYMMRKLTLLLFMIAGPVFVMFLLHPNTKGITGAYFREFIGATFIQSIHAVVFFMITAISVTSGNVIENVILYLIFIPVSESLRSLIGLGNMDSNLSKAGAMFGMASIAGVYGAIKGAKDEKGMVSAIKGAGDGAKKGGKGGSGSDGEEEGLSGTVGANTGTDTGTDSKAERMLKPGGFASKAGKATLGSVGAVAGAPMGAQGSIAGGITGSIAGGIAGGVGGRAAAAGSQFLANRKEAFERGKNSVENRSPEDKLRESLADDITKDWASENRDDYMNHLQENFPEASAGDLEKKWNDQVEYFRKNSAPGKAEEMMESLGAKKKAGAHGLASQTTKDMGNLWANHNKSNFEAEYDGQHQPDWANMSDEEKQDYKDKRSEAWGEKVSSVRNDIGNIAEATADDMKKSSEDGMINRDVYANRVSKQLAPMLSEGGSPLSENDIKKGISNSTSQVPSTLAFSKKPHVDVGDAKTKAVDNMTAAWASDNEQVFKEQYDQSHKPENFASLSQSQKQDYMDRRGQAWNNAVVEKKSQFSKAAEKAEQTVAPAGTSTQVDAKEFSQAFGQEAKELVTSDIQQSSLPPQQKTAQIQSAQSTVDHTTQQLGRSMGGNQVIGPDGRFNNNFVAANIASRKTDAIGEKKIQSAINQGVSADVAKKNWDNEKSATYDNEYAKAQAIVPSHTAQKPAGIHLGQGVMQGLKETTGLQQAAKSIQGVKTGVSEANNKVNLESTGLSAPQVIGKKIKEGSMGAVEGFNHSFAGTGAEKHHAFQHGMGYVGGLVGGVSGYQKGTKFGSLASPHKKQMEKEMYQPSEIVNMAQTLPDEKGKPQVAPGAIRMKTTNEGSHIEIRNKSGETQRVSRIGAGHSGLKDGEAVYQDISYEGNVFQPQRLPGSNNTAYRMDSGGAKIPFQSPINVNPNQLIARREMNQDKSFYEPPVFNQKVDQSGFFTDNLSQQQMEKPQMVVERDKSYVIARQGEFSYRVSPYGKGDNSLSSGEHKQVPLSLQNRRLIEDDMNHYEPPVRANELLRNKANKRYQQRQQREQGRKPFNIG